MDTGQTALSAISEPQHVLAVEPDLARVRPYTMVPDEALVDLAEQVRCVLAERVPGNFVECGVWRGGAGFLIADLVRRADPAEDRTVWLFDSFRGLPMIDTRARAWRPLAIKRRGSRFRMC